MIFGVAGEVQVVRELHQKADEWGFIAFYADEDPSTGWLGNFYPATVEYNGKTYLNSEAAFQAQKFIAHPEIMEQFTQLSGEEAFRLARRQADLIRDNWREINVQVMKEVLEAKVAQNPQIATWLEATGHCLIVEHTPVKGRDAFWADDHDGSGQNILGKLWMEIRAERRGEPVGPLDFSHPAWPDYCSFLLQQ